MKDIDKGLACFEMTSVAYGYRALDVLTRTDTARVIEASVIGSGRFMILLEDKLNLLISAEKRLSDWCSSCLENPLLDGGVISGDPEETLQALYSLSQVGAQESLLVVESETVVGLLTAAQELRRSSPSERQIQIIELKLHRSSRSGGYGFFTGPKEQCLVAAEDVRVLWKRANRRGVVEVIESPSRSFREFFNLNGEV